MGNCVYHVARQGMMASLRQVGRNLEMTNFTQALYDARELAMGRMQAEAESLEADGLVGVRLNEASHGWGSHVIEFFSIATGGGRDEGRSHDREAGAGPAAERVIETPTRAAHVASAAMPPDVKIKAQVYKDPRPPEVFEPYHARVRDHPPEWIYEAVRLTTVMTAMTLLPRRRRSGPRTCPTGP